MRTHKPLTIVALLAASSMAHGQSYDDYTLRARFMEGVLVGDQVEVVVAMFYVKHEAWPTSLGQAVQDDTEDSVPNLPSKTVQSATVGADGAIAVTFRSDVPELSNKSIVMSPTAQDDGSISWKCTAPDIPERYRSKKCN